jgi:type II secretory ATPase GspE/PulE/Tfp pilus assembly ATPase PilB-like protein
MLITRAVESRTSDIHIEPLKTMSGKIQDRRALTDIESLPDEYRLPYIRINIAS